MLVAISIILLYSLIIIYGASQIRSNYFVNSVNRGSMDAIALTFDDGPDFETTLRILDVLDADNIKATFFVIGKKAEAHPQIINEIVTRGHTVSNHSYSHSNMIGFFSVKKLNADIEKCSEVLYKIIGEKPLFFRPPFGVTNPRYELVLKKLKLVSIGWTVRSFDTTTKSKEKLFERITSSVSPGAIILLHDTNQITLETLPLLIQYFRKKNIGIVTLPELINKKPYA